ncbi:MAG: hypothetical protein K6B40_08405 [Firmicutes bacterium]|nr:hypothetical protein [Bacillota bacterium]
MSTILCIVDGMTDAGFRWQNYPALSAMQRGGFFPTTPQNMPAESLTCILTLLGVQEIPLYLRAYVEALGLGLETKEDDLILRGTWLDLDEAGDCRGMGQAPDRLFDYPDMRYYGLGSYKSILFFAGAAAYAERLTTYPPYDCLGKPVRQMMPRGYAPLAEVCEKTRSLYPGTAMIPWGQAKAVAMAAWPGRAAVVCGTEIMRGIARLLSMDLIVPPGATGDTDTDLAGKLQAALSAAVRYPLTVLHVNGGDEAGHRQDRKAKEAFLTEVDRQILRPLLNSPHTLYVASDHSTDPRSGKHGGEPQPWFYAAGTDPKKTPIAAAGLLSMRP